MQTGETAQPAISIVQYWHAEPPPGYIGDLLRTFRERNPEFRHLVFSRKSAAQFIDERFGARHAAAFASCAVPAMQADYLRYCAVLALGGIYADADFRCVASLRPLLPAGGGGQLFRGTGGNVINGVFAFGSPGHPFLELALEIATVNIEHRLFDDVYHTTGPPIFMALHLLRSCGSLAQLAEYVAGAPFADAVDRYGEVIRAYGPVAPAFEGIEVASVAEQDAFVRLSDNPLPYKGEDGHWATFEGDIFEWS